MSTSGSCRFRLLIAVATAALLLTTAAAADAAGHLSKNCVPGGPGVGDKYYPTYGNGGYDVRHYDLDIAYDPATDRLDGRGVDQREGHPEPVQLQPRPRRARGARRRGRRPARNVDAAAARSSPSRPRRPLKAGQRFEVEVTYDGVPVEFVLPGLRHPDRLHGDARRRDRRRAARGRGGVVPGERPPDRQGVLLVRRHGARRLRGRRQRRSCATATSAAARRPGSGRPASRWRRTSPRSTSASGTSTVAHGERAAGLRRGRLGDHRRPARRRSTPRWRARARSSTC